MSDKYRRVLAEVLDRIVDENAQLRADLAVVLDRIVDENAQLRADLAVYENAQLRADLAKAQAGNKWLRGALKDIRDVCICSGDRYTIKLVSERALAKKE